MLLNFSIILCIPSKEYPVNTTFTIKIPTNPTSYHIFVKSKQNAILYMKQIFCIFLFFIIVINVGSAQSKVNFIEGNLCFVQPQGHFQKNLQDNYLGLELGYLRQLKLNKPLFWGISIYWSSLGHNTATFSEVVDFEVFDFDYSTTSNLLGFNGKIRYYPAIYLWEIETFIEAQIGYKWLFTNTTKAVANDSSSSDTELDKGALSLTYGGAIGINYPVSDNLYLSIRANYLPGLSTPYYAYNHQNELVSSTLDGFDLKRSTTNIARLDIGLTYRF